MENKIPTLFEKGKTSTFLLVISNKKLLRCHFTCFTDSIGTKTLQFSQMFSIYIIIISLGWIIGFSVSLQVISYFSKNAWSCKPMNIRTAATEHATLEDRFYIILSCWVAREAEHFLSICSQCCLDIDSIDQAENTFPSPSITRYQRFCWRLFLYACRVTVFDSEFWFSSVKMCTTFFCMELSYLTGKMWK